MDGRAKQMYVDKSGDLLFGKQWSLTVEKPGKYQQLHWHQIEIMEMDNMKRRLDTARLKGPLPAGAHIALVLPIASKNSPIYDECQTISAKVVALPWKWAHQDDWWYDTPQHIIFEFQVGFPLLWLETYIVSILIYPNPQLK